MVYCNLIYFIYQSYFHVMMIVPYIPTELINIIFEYDGRIKYRQGEYVNIIHKKDVRYDTIKPIIDKKKEILKDVQIYNKTEFYFEFRFDICPSIGLCYDYHFSYTDKFEICYFDFRESLIQIRTYI
jgi:hypothetical protein